MPRTPSRRCNVTERQWSLASALELFAMMSEAPSQSSIAVVNSFSAADVRAVLCERGWLGEMRENEADAAMEAWIARASELLGPQAADRGQLAGLLALVFHYDASALLDDAANQAVLTRVGARQVIRELANRVLDGGDVDSDRYKEIIDGIKAALPYRSRVLFHPVRLTLAGRVGEGELDRVILLLDSAAKLGFAKRPKGSRQRILEFCAALD